MQNMIAFVNSKVSSINFNESLSSMIRDKIKESPIKLYAGDYYNLVDLCNPIKIYHDRISPPVEKSIELQKKLEWGTKLHEITQNWLKSYREFVITEGTIDGIWVGIPKVRGRIDCKIGDSIFEIKTKKELPNDVSDILSKYPQDVEQLSFYSVIHPSHDKINYLLFIKDSQPFELKVFKLEIKDLSRIRSLLESRIKLIDTALETKNPLYLGRCRYYDDGCPYQESGECFCEKLQPLSMDQIEKSIKLSFDDEMTRTLEELRQNYHYSKPLFTTYNLIASRKYDIKEEINVEKEKQESQNYLHAIIRKLPVKLSPEQRIDVVNLVQEKRLYIPYRWLNARSASSDNAIPYIVKSNMSSSLQTKPHEYYLAELGLIVSNYKKSRGIIFIISPKCNNFIQAFEINYNQTKEISNKTKEILDELEKQEVNLFNLPPCPSFINNMRNCPKINICNVNSNMGCVN